MPVAEEGITERSNVILFFICIAPRSGRGIKKIPAESYFSSPKNFHLAGFFVILCKFTDNTNYP
mgnify:CR=1